MSVFFFFFFLDMYPPHLGPQRYIDFIIILWYNIMGRYRLLRAARAWISGPQSENYKTEALYERKVGVIKFTWEDCYERCHIRLLEKHGRGAYYSSLWRPLFLCRYVRDFGNSRYGSLWGTFNWENRGTKARRKAGVARALPAGHSRARAIGRFREKTGWETWITFNRKKCRICQILGILVVDMRPRLAEV